MTKNADALVQKLTKTDSDKKAKEIVKNISAIVGEEEISNYAQELIDSEEVSRQVSGILILRHLNETSALTQLYELGLDAPVEVTKTLLQATSNLTDARSNKYYMLQLEKSTAEDVVKVAVQVAPEKKNHTMAKAFLLALERNMDGVSDLIDQVLEKLAKKKFISVIRALLRNKEQSALLFAFSQIQRHPHAEFVTNVTKFITAKTDLPVLEKAMETVPSFPESSASMEAVRAILELSRGANDQLWKAIMRVVHKFEDIRERMAIDFFKDWFNEFATNRQFEILELLGQKRSSYDVRDLCLWASTAGREIKQKASEILLEYHPDEALYEMFKFTQDYPEHNKNIVPYIIQIADKTNTNLLEDMVQQLPTDLQRDMVQLLSERSQGTSSLMTALFKSVARDYNKLDEFGTLLSGLDYLPRCYERESELETILKRLGRDGNKSFILLGASGSGKSAIFNELAYRLATAKEGEYAYEQVLQITTGDILAGTKYLGEWETRVNKLIQTLKGYNKVLLYVSNINDLIWAGRSSSSRTNFASVMSPYIERGEIVVVGESNPEAYSIGIGSEYSVKKLFQTIQLKEMDDNRTEEVLRKVTTDLRHQIKRSKNVDIEVPSTVIHRIIELATYYFPGIVKPGNAADLLRQVMETRSDDLTRNDQTTLKSIILTPDDVMKTLADTMEVPELIINDAIKLDIEEAVTFFSERVLGQEKAIRSIVSLITLIKAGLTNPEKPHGVFFFIGPTGVGKTELARVLAEYLTGNPDRLVRIDMSAFKDYSSFERLIGSHHHLTPQGTYMSPNLVEKIRNHPFSVILLDEFEKAHPNIFDLFLQVFDYGKLMDARSENIDFRQSIIIMTSNLGYEGALEARMGFDDSVDMGLSEEQAKVEMGRFFRPEFINRIDRITVFNPLDKDTMLRITHREMGKILSRSGILRRNLAVKVSDAVVELLLEKGFSPQLGARYLKREVEQRLLLPLAETIVKLGSDHHGSNIYINAKDGEVKVDITESRAKSRNTRILKRLRRKNKDSTRLVTPEMLLRWIEDMSNSLSTLEAYCEAKDYPRWKRKLSRKTTDVTFWDDTEEARGILEEIHYLERILHSVDKLRKDVTELENDYGVKSTRDSEKTLSKGALRYMEVKKEFEIVSFEAHCETREERSDAFVIFSTELPSRLNERSGIEILYSMYQKWCDRNAFSLLPIDEKVFNNGTTESLVCYLQGVCVSGLLRGEDGFHSFIEEADGQKHTDNIRVQIIPKLPHAMLEQDFQVLDTYKEWPRNLLGNMRSLVMIEHLPSKTVLRAANNKPRLDNIQLLKDYMAAKMKYHHADNSESIRTYKLTRPNVYIQDHTLNTTYSNVDEILGGDMDEMLLRRVKKLKQDDRES